MTKADFNLEHLLPAPRLGHRGNSGLFLFRSPALCFRLFRQGNYVFFDFLVLGLHGLGLVERPRGPGGGILDIYIYILRATPPAAGPLRAVSADLGGLRDGF